MPFVEMNGYERLLYPARIFILKSLSDTKSIRFQKFREDLKMKDGSLWSNMRNLEDMGMVTMRKEVDEGGREAYATYTITEKGKSAYADLRNKLLELLR